MKFDIKDVKTWSNRHDVKVCDVGYVTCDFTSFILTTKVALLTKATVKDIDDNDSRCFLAQPLDGIVKFHYGFFLPVDAVKEDKPKEKVYRPFKSMIELTEIAEITNPNSYNVMGVDEALFVKRKCNGHYEKVLITHLEYDKYHNLIAINNKNLKTWFENYELMNGFGKYVPFGVEVTEE